MYIYRTVVKVLLLGGNGEKHISHLLLTNSNDFQIDLSGDCLFNELPVLTVLNEDSVNSLNDVLAYCSSHNITLSSCRTSKGGLLVGGGKSFLINQDLIGNWYMNNNSLFDEITDYIIKKVQGDSIISGFQYIISFNVIEEKFGIILKSDYIECILELLLCREEVAEVELYRDSFDVTLYTYFAPNYCKENYCEELEEIPF